MSELVHEPAATPDSPTICIEVALRDSPTWKGGGEPLPPLVRAGRELGVAGLTGCRASRLYFLQGTLDAEALTELTGILLADPVTETWRVRGDDARPAAPASHAIEVSFLPGVTDSAAANLVATAHHLGLSALERAASGQRFEVSGELSADDLALLASGLFANPVIERYAIDQPLPPPFFPYQAADATVETIPVRDANDETLLAISQERRLALDLNEMRAIQTYYQAEDRDPTDVELETLAQTWSEHCVHKTFRALIDYDGPPSGPDATAAPVAQTVDGLLKSMLRAVTEQLDKPWVRSAFVDNAGIVAFDDRFDLAFKVETHNHPSALEPFGGANTGVGGVVRDVLGVSARPIANTDVLCFGPQELAYDALPAGVLHPARVAAGVVHGIEDYGNKLGIPTVNGAIAYHPGYTANPLVYCGCLGILPRASHRTAAEPGDLIVAIGGGTGRDGLRGATFSSMEMDHATSDVAGSAVQIGNPIIEKQVMEVVLRARDAGLYTAITDCGAGGFSSAVGEMGADIGASVELQNVDLKYPGLRPWEIWLSEAQERMVLAVPPGNIDRLRAICQTQDVTLTMLGTFEPSGRLQVRYGGRLVGDLSMDFLHDGLPRRHLSAVWRPPAQRDDDSAASASADAGALLLALLGHPNIRSKEGIIRRYDHEVQGGGAVKPLVGVAGHGPSDAAVIVPLDTQGADQALSGVALGNGLCPWYSERDPYRMAWAAVDEALRNVVAVGADPDRVAILDNFCWGNPNLPDRLGALVRSAQGCRDAALAYQTPFVSGKDSLNNEYTDELGRKQAIPGTLLISALGHVPDTARTVTMDLKQAGDFIFVVGDTRPELGGSHFEMVGGRVAPQHQAVPMPAEQPMDRLRAVHRAIRAGFVRACHDCSEGGIGVAMAEMCLAGELGVEMQMRAVPVDPYYAYAADPAVLFSESLTRFLVEVRPEDAAAFSATLGDIPHACIGVVGGDALVIHPRLPGAADPLIRTTVDELRHAFLGDAARAPEPRAAGLAAPTGSQRRAPLPISRPRILILHANGTNRDRDAALACELAGGDPEIVHVNQLVSGGRDLLDYHMLVVPGGFSYGDDLGAGVLWAVDLGRRGDHALGVSLGKFVADGRPVLGICNGFQALVKAGVLPGDHDGPRRITLTHNASGHFECRWVYLEPNPASPSLFTRGVATRIYCPVAHGEGRFLAYDETTLAALQHDNLIALTYASGDGTPVAYPANPNGSALHIAGLTNAAGNVLGLMPHPEDHVFPWQHPRAHRGERGLMGLRLFENGVNAC